jgi:hypothetical protein
MDLESLTKELATIEEQLASDEAAVHRGKDALDQLRKRLGPSWTPRREELEGAKREAESVLALHKQQRDHLLARIEHEKKASEAEREPAVEVQRADGINPGHDGPSERSRPPRAPASRRQERLRSPTERAKDVELEVDF